LYITFSIGFYRTGIESISEYTIQDQFFEKIDVVFYMIASVFLKNEVILCILTSVFITDVNVHTFKVDIFNIDSKTDVECPK